MIVELTRSDTDEFSITTTRVWTYTRPEYAGGRACDRRLYSIQATGGRIDLPSEQAQWVIENLRKLLHQSEPEEFAP